MRNVPCTQLTMEYSPRVVLCRNRITSSPGRNRGTPETVELRFPTDPPSSRTVSCCAAPDGAPFHESSTANEVNVQISPPSHAAELPMHCARTTSCAACVIFATHMRSSVVAEALIVAQTCTAASKGTIVIFRNRIFISSHLASSHLQHPRGHRAIVVQRSDEQSPYARQSCAGNLQIELDRVRKKSSNGRSRHNNVAAARRSTRSSERINKRGIQQVAVDAQAHRRRPGCRPRHRKRRALDSTIISTRK